MTDRVGGAPVETGWGSRSSIIKHLILSAASFVMLYPVLWMLSGAVRPPTEIFSSVSLWPSQINFDSFARGWTGLEVDFGVFFFNSFVIAGLSVIGNLVSCTFAAYAFTRIRFKFRGFWFALMMGTLLLPYHVILVPQYILFRNLGWVGSILPLVVPKFLAVDAFFIFLMVQFFRGVPRELDEAAMIDGAGPWHIYRTIMLPLAVPALATTAVFTFIWTWDDFLGPLIYLNDMRSYTVQLGLRTFVDSTGQSDYGALFAMSILSLLPIFILFVLFQRLLIAGIATTGLK